MNVDKLAEANEADRLEGRPITLADQIARWTAGKNRFDGPIQGLALHRWETPTEPTSYLLPPSICLIGQGRKRLFLGESVYAYDAHRFLMTSVDLPVVTQIIEASSDKPYLGLTLELNLRMVGQVMLGSDVALARSSPDKNPLGIVVSQVSPRLRDAFQRLLDLLEHPQDIAVLAPLVQQEITYHLLTSEQGPRLRQITSIGNHSYRIARAIDWLKDHFNQRLRIEDLANKAGLSTSAFHNHFRSVTTMSPLQFQKKMRLNEARRLMLTEHMEAATAAYEVGYDSPSQFSREYSRQFGVPPMRDIKNLVHPVAAG